MKFFNGEKVEVVLSPAQGELNDAIQTARILMAKKLEQWILDRLTIEQLENCVRQFESEIIKRRSET